METVLDLYGSLALIYVFVLFTEKKRFEYCVFVGLLWPIDVLIIIIKQLKKI